MSEMIERVAEAIMRVEAEDKISDYYKFARAAIGAMRYPSDGMVASMGSDWGFALEDQWNKMIDTALAD